MMKKITLIALMAVMSHYVVAQSTDALYPKGRWQSDGVKGYTDLYILRDWDTFYDYNNTKAHGALEIIDKNKTIYEALVYYGGKGLKDNMPDGGYFFDVVSKQKRQSRIEVQKVIKGENVSVRIVNVTGDLANNTHLDKELSWVQDSNGANYDPTSQATSEKDLLDMLRNGVENGFAIKGFGNLQQYINAHAKLDPSKPKYAKCKGTGSINIRKNADAKSEKIGDLKPGTTIPVVDEHNGWCQVRLGQKSFGWVSLSVVTLTNTPSGNNSTNMSSSVGVASSKQRSHMEFLGLEMGGDAATFVKALRQKGFKDGNGFSQDKSQIFLSGMVWGMKSEICVYTENNRVVSVSVVDMVNSRTAAINRCNRYKKEINALYGGGKWKKPYDGAEELTLPYGKVKYEYGMFDSGVYELSLFMMDEGKTEPASQPSSNTEMVATNENPINNPEVVNAGFNIIEFASQMIQLNDFDKIREQALANSFKPSTDKARYFSAERTIGKKENFHTDRLSKKFSKVYVVSTFVSEWNDNEIISTLQRLGYVESEVKNTTLVGYPIVTRIYQHPDGKHYVEFETVQNGGKFIKELKFKNK